MSASPAKQTVLVLLCLFLTIASVHQCALAQKKDDATAANAPKKVPIGKSGKLFLEVDGKSRRVLLDANVCLRQGALEQFLTKTRTKEHEAILMTDVDASEIHKALVLAGAVEGSPVKFRPKFEPATGSRIDIFVEYEDKGKTVRHPAQEWIRNYKTMKQLDSNWVFGGSILIPNERDNTKPPFYAANDGDVICVSNFPEAMLDLPINSSADNDDLAFEANTDRIPALKTHVLVILQPVITEKK